MIGYPKHLNTKADYEFVRTHFPKNNWEKDFKNLLAGEYTWINTGELAKDDSGKTDDTHRVSEADQEGKRYQYEKILDPYSKMKQIGYTHEEIMEILA